MSRLRAPSTQQEIQDLQRRINCLEVRVSRMDNSNDVRHTIMAQFHWLGLETHFNGHYILAFIPHKDPDGRGRRWNQIADWLVQFNDKNPAKNRHRAYWILTDGAKESCLARILAAQKDEMYYPEELIANPVSPHSCTCLLATSFA